MYNKALALANFPNGLFITEPCVFCILNGRWLAILKAALYTVVIRAGSSTSRPYRDERSGFNWSIRHPTTNLIINVERGTYRSRLVHASDSRFKTYCVSKLSQADSARRNNCNRSLVLIHYTVSRFSC